MSVQDVLIKIRNQKAAIVAVKNDGDLSEDGKAKRIKSLSEPLTKMSGDFAAALASEMESIKTGYRRAEKKGRAAMAEIDKTFDGQRLNYHALRIKALLESSRNLGEVRRQFQEDADKDDRNALRVWFEVAPSLMGKTFTNLDAQGTMDFAGLLRQITREGQRVKTSPELTAALKEGAELTQRALDLRLVTDEAKTFYPKLVVTVEDGGRLQPAHPFDVAWKGVTLSQSFHPDDPEHFSTTMLEVAPEA